jgi:hypothetical protein
MPRRPSVAPLALLALLAACVAPTGLVSDGTLEVLPRPADVQLHNLSDRAAYYFIAERGILALIDWRPCVTADCPSVGPHERLTIPHERIIGFTPGAREAVVYWWHAAPTGAGTFTADSIRSLVIRL